MGNPAAIRKSTALRNRLLEVRHRIIIGFLQVFDRIVQALFHILPLCFRGRADFFELLCSSVLLFLLRAAIAALIFLSAFNP